MAKKLSVRDLDVKGKRVLVRVDFNVPVKDGAVADDTRIRAALPTLRNVLDRGGSLVLMSHLGRPKGEGAEPAFSLKPAADRLAELLGSKVTMAGDCVGAEVESLAKSLAPGGVLLLENTRFHKAEKKNDPAFARELAAMGELYANDAFGTAHRAHASTEGAARLFEKRAAGLLMEREIEFLTRALESPGKPFVAILGGAKVSDKIGVIENLLSKVDALLVGGAMAYTFLKAQGVPVGASKTEDDKLDLARGALEKANATGAELLLPSDHVAGDAFSADARTETVGLDGIKDGWLGLDIGPGTREAYAARIAGARTIVWNGPMGVFEMAPFAAGTLAVAEAVAAATDAGATSIIGGGDSVAAVNAAGLASRMSHISTGGGASLELLEGKTLPGIAVLTDV